MVPPHNIATVGGFPPDIAGKAMFFSQGFCRCQVDFPKRWIESGFGGFGQSV
jgi:hypothetical protein